MNGVDGRLNRVDGRLDRIDGRLDRIDRRLDRIDGRLDGIDGRLEPLESGFTDMRADVMLMSSCCGGTRLSRARRPRLTDVPDAEQT